MIHVPQSFGPCGYAIQQRQFCSFCLVKDAWMGILFRMAHLVFL